MTRSRALSLILASLVLGQLARGAELRLVGTDLAGPGVRALVEAYARDNDVKLSLQLDGTRPGLDRLRSGAADLGLFLLPPGEPPPGDPIVTRVIAYQPVVLVVPEKLPVKQLTVAQVRGIFAATGGENLSVWGDLGLTDVWRIRPIGVHAVEPRSALTVSLLRRELLDGAELKTLANTAPLDRVLERVRSSDNGIGAVPGLPGGASGLRVVALAASVKTPAYLPTAENLHDGSYPARLPLCLAFRREAAPGLLVLLRQLLSDEGGELLAQSGFVPLPVGLRHQLVFELEGLL